MNRRKLFFIIIIFCIISAGAHAAVTLRLQQVTKNIKIDHAYENSAVYVYTVTLRHKGDATDFFLTFSSGQSPSFSPRLMADGAGSFIEYELYDDILTRNVLKDLSAGPSANEILSGFFPASTKWQTLDVTYTLFVQEGQFVSQGAYDDSFILSLYEGNPIVWTEHDSQAISLQAQMPQILDVAVVNSGIPFDVLSQELVLDFGILYEGDLLGGDIVVRSNALFSLALQSENQGVMPHADPLDTSVVPYIFTFNGSPVTLTGTVPVSVVPAGGPSDVNGERYPFSVAIGNYGMATEGSYQDVITLTIAAN